MTAVLLPVGAAAHGSDWPVIAAVVLVLFLGGIVLVARWRWGWGRRR